MSPERQLLVRQKSGPGPVEFRVIVCGSRDWTNRLIIRETLLALADTYPDLRIVVVHGAARGADRIAGEEARACGYKVEEHPANWRYHGKRAGLIRNAHMLSLGCSQLIAFWDGKSRGTEHMIRIAREADARVVVIREGRVEFSPLGGAARGVGRCVCAAGPGTNPACGVHP